MDSKELMGQPTTIASGMYDIKDISFYWFRTSRNHSGGDFLACTVFASSLEGGSCQIGW